MGTPYILFARGLRTITAQEAGLITLVEPVMNPIWVWILWQQPIARHTMIGGGLILVALLTRYLLPFLAQRATKAEISSI